MPEKDPDLVYLHSLPPLVIQAIRLLHKHRRAALPRVGCHTARGCPLSGAYRISAVNRWYNLHFMAREKLLAIDWTQRTYESFISWYDSHLSKDQAETLLRRVLAQKEFPLAA
jgi:hypothetical protein